MGRSVLYRSVARTLKETVEAINAITSDSLLASAANLTEMSRLTLK